jgi:hypothetical protein
MFPEMLVFSGIMPKRSGRMSRFVPAMALSCLLAAFFLAAGCSLPVDTASAASYTPGVAYSARVIHVTDGDTLHVVFPGGDQETVRILGVDTPEVTPDGTDPGSFEGVSDPVFLRSWGEEATSMLRREVEGREVTVTTDRAAGERTATAGSLRISILTRERIWARCSLPGGWPGCTHPKPSPGKSGTLRCRKRPCDTGSASGAV